MDILKNPISMSELVGEGANFDITADFQNQRLYDDFNFDSDDDDVEVEEAKLVSPWTRSFDELRQEMVKIDEFMYKRIEISGNKEKGKVPDKARVTVRYSAYWERDGAPFDSTFLRGTSFCFCTGQGEALEGMEAAVRTMNIGETALFLISYHLLYRELGCPPRIKPRADGLFKIEVINFNLVGDMDAYEQIKNEDRDKFDLIIDSIKQIHLKGLDYFQQGSYRKAVGAFQRAVTALNYCHLANEKEQNEQNEFLIRLYTNLAVCFNKLKIPAKTCIMVKEIRSRTNNNPSCKVLFQEGRALFMLSEYKRAHILLMKAMQMEPNNTEIRKELNLLDERTARYQKSEREIWTKALGMINSNNEKDKNRNKSKLRNGQSEEHFEEQRKCFEKLLKDFKDNLTLEKISIPEKILYPDVDMMEELAAKMELSLTISPLDCSNYILSKKTKKLSSN